MTNPIVKRCCILIEGMLASPLLAGSGLSEENDYDVICDADGRPFAPGSSLAGAFQHYLTGKFAGEEEQKAIQALFGSRYKSRLHCYHLHFKGEDHDVYPYKRDGVKLDSYKTAVDQAKYTLQMVERGAKFEFRLEWIIRAESEKMEEIEEALICELIDGIAVGSLTIGAKGRRGFGKLNVEQVSCCLFNHHRIAKESSERWLDWYWDRYDRQMKWEPGKSALLADIRTKQLSPAVAEHELKVPLKIKHTIMIRQYATEAAQHGTSYDYEQLKYTTRGKQYVIIPGTSWAGAIRHHLASLLEELGKEPGEVQKKLVPLFGSWIEGTNKKAKQEKLIASRLWIAESVIEGGSELPTTRTAIDRFTGGTVTGALYTSKPWVGGTTELTIRWRDAASELSKEAICGLLLWVIRDLQDGILAVGGETAIGRGLMEACGAIELDGKPIDDQKQTSYCRAALEWCKRPARPDKGEGGRVDAQARDYL